MSATEVYSPIPQGLYPFLSVTLTGAGLCSAGLLYISEIVKTKQERGLKQDVILAVVSSVLLGFGVFFLLLWCGVYV